MTPDNFLLLFLQLFFSLSATAALTLLDILSLVEIITAAQRDRQLSIFPEVKVVRKYDNTNLM